MDKYHAREFLHNIVIHNTLFICGRIVDWETQNPIRVLGLYRLVDSHVVSIWWAVFGHFMRRAKWWAYAKSGSIE